MKRAFTATDSWNVVALDPSTDWTGAVLMHIPFEGAPKVLQFAAISGDWSTADPSIKEPRRKDLRGVADRIYRTCYYLKSRVNLWKREVDRIDIVAFEDVQKFQVPGQRGSLTERALIASTVGYLSIPQFIGLPLEPIVRVSACSAVGAYKVYNQPSGSTKKEQDAKRARLKQAVIDGVIERMPEAFAAQLACYSREEQEAICDAAAVGLAAGLKLVEAERLARAEAAQPKMALRRAPRKAKVAA